MSTTLKSPTPEAKRKSFSEFFESIDYGAFSDEATSQLNDLVHAVTETGKAGSITLDIKLKPVGKGAQMEIATDVKVKTPKAARGVTIMFATPDNNLQREDPRQKTLDGLRTADQEAADKAALRVVG